MAGQSRPSSGLSGVPDQGAINTILFNAIDRLSDQIRVLKDTFNSFAHCTAKGAQTASERHHGSISEGASPVSPKMDILETIYDAAFAAGRSFERTKLGGTVAASKRPLQPTLPFEPVKAPRPSEDTSGSGSKEVRCGRCRKTSHPGKNCSGTIITCYQCKEPGHKSHVCPKKAVPVVNEKIKPRCHKCQAPRHHGKNCKGEDLPCFLCGRTGHRFVTCPKKVTTVTAPSPQERITSPVLVEPTVNPSTTVGKSFVYFSCLPLHLHSMPKSFIPISIVNCELIIPFDFQSYSD